MKRLILIGSKDARGKNDIKAIARAFDGRNVKPAIAYWEDLLFEISQNRAAVTDAANATDIKQADLVISVNWYKSGEQSIYRDIAFALAVYLKHHAIEFWNGEMGSQRSTTKLSALMQLSLAGFDVPETFYSLSSELLAAKAKHYPVIVKSMAASRGEDNYLVTNSGEFKKLLADKDKINKYLLEEYLPNDSDLRIICFGGEPRLVLRRERTSKKTHLNNTSRGASAELIGLDNISNELKNRCRDICRLMGREMAGIDIIETNDGLSRQVFLEVNAVPQLTSGTFIDEKLDNLSSFVDGYLGRKA